MENGLKSLKNCKTFAILGGTFDPIHYGHLTTGEEILKKTDAEKVIFLPVGDPPHKTERTVTEGKYRGAMTRLAIKNHQGFVFSSVEMDRKGKTYTIDTVRQLRAELGEDKKFYFVMGADAMMLIDTWKESQELLKICSFIAVTRPGYDTAEFEKFVSELKKRQECDIKVLEIPAVDISSSRIRQYVSQGKSIKGFVPAEVEEYIKENGLYK